MKSMIDLIDKDGFLFGIVTESTDIYRYKKSKKSCTGYAGIILKNGQFFKYGNSYGSNADRKKELEECGNV